LPKIFFRVSLSPPLWRVNPQIDVVFGEKKVYNDYQKPTTDGKGMSMGFLAFVGMAGTVLAMVLLLWILARLVGIRRRNRRLRPHELPQAATPPAIVVWKDTYQTEKALWISRFHVEYGKLRERMTIPADAHRVVKCSCVFSLEHKPIEHDAWISGGVLYYFPRWESIAGFLQDPAYIHRFREKEAEVIFGWMIPADRLEYYVVDEENALTTVYYHSTGEKLYSCVFLDGGAQLLREAFPQKDAVLLERQIYLGSSRNIEDMATEMRTRKAQLEQGKLSPAEYEAHKKRVLRDF
jgi:hypothetical protein